MGNDVSYKCEQCNNTIIYLVPKFSGYLGKVLKISDSFVAYCEVCKTTRTFIKQNENR